MELLTNGHGGLLLQERPLTSFLLVAVPLTREVVMLPPFIIEEIRKREAAKKRLDDQPTLELPLRRVPLADAAQDRGQGSEGPGVVIIDIL